MVGYMVPVKKVRIGYVLTSLCTFVKPSIGGTLIFLRTASLHEYTYKPQPSQTHSNSFKIHRMVCGVAKGVYDSLFEMPAGVYAYSERGIWDDRMMMKNMEGFMTIQNGYVG